MSELTQQTFLQNNASDPALSVTADGGRVLFFVQPDAGDNYGIWAQRYDANGVETGAIYQINTVETDAQTQPEVTVLNDDRILVTWVSGIANGIGEVRGRILDANGNLVLGSEDFLITPADTTANYARDQEVTALADGGFVAVWSESHDDTSLRGIYGQRFDSTGTPAGDDFRIRDPQFNGEGEAEVLALAGGGFVVTWSDGAGLWGSDATGGIFGQMYDAAGAPVGSEFHVNTTTNEEQEQSQMLALADGGFMVFWLHDDNPQDLRFQRYDADGTTVGTERVLATDVAVRHYQEAAGDWKVITLEGGGLAALWRTSLSSNEFHVQSFDLDGTAITDVVTINSRQGSFDNSTHYTTDIDQLPDGQLIVTWEYENSAGFGEIYTQTIDAPPALADLDGQQQLVPTTLVASDPALSVTADGGRVLFFVQADAGDNYGIWAQRYDANGVETGAIYQINTVETGRQVKPEVTVLKDGRILLSWMSGGTVDGTGEVRGRILDANGDLVLGSEDFLITPADTTANYARDQEVTALADGGFVAVWSESHDDTSLRGIYGQRFDSTGTPAGDDFRIRDPQFNGEGEAEVLALAGGGFVVTWSDGAGLWGSDATGGIFGQMYDAAGAPVGSEFHVNTTTNEEQEQSQMLALADGGFMVFWLHDDNPQDLRFQRYDADGTTVGTERVLATDVAVRHYQADAGDWKVINLEGGGLAALWRTSLASDEFHVQSFDLDGTAITDVVTIDSQQGGFDNSTHYTADIDQLPDGQLIVTWEYENTAGFGEIYTQTIDAPPALADLDGQQQLVPTTLVASDPALSVTADGGRVLFFVQADAGDNYGIWAQRYDANGVETGAIYQINTVETGRQVKPEVTVLKDGRILLSWMSGGTVDGTGEVQGRILDANGNLMSGNDDFLITPADTTANYARDQEVTALEDGGFVAVWYEYHDDSSLRGIYGQHFDATGTAVGDDFRIRDPQYYGENEAEVLALKDADGDGKAGFVVTWSANSGLWGSDATGGIFGQIYKPDPVTGDMEAVGSEFHVNTTTNEEQEQSQMLALADGGFMVFWLHDDNPQDLRFQRYDADGTTVGTEGVLATDVAVRHYQADAGDWKVINLEGGGLAALWRTSLSSNEFHVQSFDLDGTAITDVVTIDSQQGGFDNSTHYTADIDQLPDGQLIVTWEYENTAGFGEIYTQTIDAPPALADLDGQQQLVPTTLVASDPALSVTADGGRVLFFVQADAGDNYGIWAQRYDANGVETGAIYQINTVETDAQTQPEATVLSDGRILVIWMSGNSNGTGEVRGRILDANGNPVAGNDDDLITPADTTANYAKTPEITALADGGFVAVWYEYHSSSSKRSVYLQQFDSAGNAITHYDQAGDPISGPIRVPSPISNNQTVPDVLALDTGGYVVTWTATKGVSGTDSYGGIFGQMFDSVGTPVGDDFHVNTTTADDQEHSRLVTLQDGGFMVLWKHDGSPDQLRFQKYYSDGTPSGGEGTLATGATMTDMGAEWQAISLLGGGVAVAWHRSDGDLYVQSFDEAGNSLTEVTTIETSLSTSNGANFTSDLDQLASGQLVVTWEYKGEVYSQTLSVPPDVAETVLTQGNDIFVGSTSGETILGLAGDDTIDGSGGDDRIEGGAGNDSLTGGNGADTFVFDAATGSDTVSDFTDESDLIEIETTGMPDGTGFANLVLTDMGSDLYVSFADPSITTVIKINNLSSAEFLDDDVIFV